MAQPIVLTTRHQLSVEDVKRRIDERFEAMKGNGTLAKLAALRLGWEGDVASFGAKALGQSVTGTVVVGDHDLVITIHLPPLLRPMRGAIVAMLEAQEDAIKGKQ